MAKYNWFLQLLENLYTTCDSNKPNPKKKKGMRCGWICKRPRIKKIIPTSSRPRKPLSEAREEQRGREMDVAKATEAAAEAALAAAQVAAEAVRLTKVARWSVRRHKREVQTLAAIKIQTAFRAFLAMKALRALKGVIMLQAIARGQVVRRRMMRFMPLRKHLALNVLKNPPMIDAYQRVREGQRSPLSDYRGERSEFGYENGSPRLFAKEFESIYFRTQEAATRRGRMKQYCYSSSHRERQYDPCTPEQMIPSRNDGGHISSLRKQWIDNYNTYDERRRHFGDQDKGLIMLSPPVSHPRRLYDRGGSPSPRFPAYMAATESAKAKMRFIRSPKTRMGHVVDANFEPYGSSPFKHNNGVCYRSTISDESVALYLGKANYSPSSKSTT